MKSTAAGAGGVKAKSALAGCLVGGGAAVCLISFGILCSLTGIGAIIGVPFILAGLASLCLGPLMGWLNGNAVVKADLGAFKADCPWCGYGVLVRPKLLRSPGLDCPICKKRVIVKGRAFIKVF